MTVIIWTAFVLGWLACIGLIIGSLHVSRLTDMVYDLANQPPTVEIPAQRDPILTAQAYNEDAT